MNVQILEIIFYILSFRNNKLYPYSAKSRRTVVGEGVGDGNKNNFAVNCE
jgi:hypothetical protein